MFWRILLCSGALCSLHAAGEEAPLTSPWSHEELQRISTDEARQGVATDGAHVFAIDNRAIGKYRIDTGAKTAAWQGGKDGPITHLNSGVVIGDRLYCAHSNYPGIPTVSSVEIFDTGDLKHVGTQSFGVFVGSLTWVDRKNDCWYACFAQYGKSGPESGKAPGYTQLVKFDAAWRRLEGWVFPKLLVARFGSYSSSGGAFGPAGQLFATGHDAKELYTLELPEAGSELRWSGTIPISAAGQAFSFDPMNEGLFYSIQRSTKQIIVSRVVKSKR